MAGPLEVIVSSDSGSQLWNSTVFDLHSGSSLLSYRGGNSSARALTVLGGQYLLSAQLGKNFINVWEIQRKVRVTEHTCRHVNATQHTCCMSPTHRPKSPESLRKTDKTSPNSIEKTVILHRTLVCKHRFSSKTKCITDSHPVESVREFGMKIIHQTSLNFL